MAEPLRPDPTKLFGAENHVLVQTIAGYTSGTGPAVAEMAATSSLDITNIAYRDGALNPDQSVNQVTLPPRLGDTQTFSFNGQITYSAGDLTYQMAAQAAASSDGVKLWEKISAGGLWFVVRRLGVAKATAFAAGQWVDVFPVDISASIPVKMGDNDGQVSAAKATFQIYNKPLFRVQVVA